MQIILGSYSLVIMNLINKTTKFLFVIFLFLLASGLCKKEEDIAVKTGDDPSALIEKGKALFKTKTQPNCETCHGPDGKGDTPTGKAIKARNFTADAFKQGENIEDIVKTIFSGVPGTGMVSFKPQLSEEEATALAHFVKSLRPKK